MNRCKLLCYLLGILMIGCTPKDKKKNHKVVDSVINQEMQDKLTPNSVLEDLLEGNKRYVSGEMIHRDLPAQIVASTEAQFPKAVIVACIDSRVPVEYLFDQGIGDLFVVRVAGNIENEEILGSMEYGMVYSGCKLLMVLGHENCGAIKASINHFKSESKNVKSILKQVEPVIQNTNGERNAKDKIYFKKVVKNNVAQTIKDIRSKSPMMAQMEKENKIKIIGAFYSLTDGKVHLFPQQ